MSPSSQLPSDRDPKAPQASPDPDVSTDPPAPDDAGAAAAGPNPAKKVALIVAVVLVVLMTWYVLTDRYAPYTSRGTVATWVTQIGPRVGGQVGEVFVHDNQFVRRGAPLFALDPRPFEVAVQQAEAALAQATQGIDASSAALAASQADVAQARVNLANTRLATARTLELERQQQSHPEGRAVQKHRQPRGRGVLQTHIDARELARKQRPCQQAGPPASLRGSSARGDPPAPQAPGGNGRRGHGKAHKGLEHRRHLGHRGLEQHLLEPPEHAAGQQQGDGEGVEVGFAGGAHRLIMVK